MPPSDAPRPPRGHRAVSYPYSPGGFLVAESAFLANHVLLLVGLVGLARSGAPGTSRTGRTGSWIAITGMGLLSVCEAWAMTFVNSAWPTAQTDLLDIAYGVSTIAIGIGLLIVGGAVMRSRIWHGWPRYVPMSCGVAVFVIVLPGVFGPMLLGRLVLTAWMLLFAALGLALMRTSTPGSW